MSNTNRYCDVCGEFILGNPQFRMIEGSKVVVCRRCAKFGTKTRPSDEYLPIKPSKKDSRRFNNSFYPKNNEDSSEIISQKEDYFQIIRKARQKKGWDQYEFAHRLKEKVSDSRLG